MFLFVKVVPFEEACGINAFRLSIMLLLRNLQK